MRFPLCVYAHVCTCVCAPRVCCIRGDAALCLPQWSIWKAVREMNDCCYIDYCSLPLRYLLPLSFLSAPCSTSPSLRPSTSPLLPFFTPLPSHSFSTPPFTLSSSHFSPLCPRLCYPFSIFQNLRPCHRYYVAEWPLEGADTVLF